MIMMIDSCNELAAIMLTEATENGINLLPLIDTVDSR